MSRAFVTGGGGYVGGKLCTALCERGYAVTAADVQFLDKVEQDGVRKVEVCVCADSSPLTFLPCATRGT